MSATTQEPEIKGFDQPKAVLDLELAFGGKMDKLLPPYNQLPEEFRRGRSKFCKVVDHWFFSGLPKETKFTPAPGIDDKAAIRHVRAILCSFEPKHEHKTAGVAWLLSKWFSDIQIPDAA